MVLVTALRCEVGEEKKEPWFILRKSSQGYERIQIRLTSKIMTRTLSLLGIMKSKIETFWVWVTEGQPRGNVH